MGAPGASGWVSVPLSLLTKMGLIYVQVSNRLPDRLYPDYTYMHWPVKIPFLASLALYGVDEYREAFDMALESSFEAFDADEVARRSHRHRIPS